MAALVETPAPPDPPELPEGAQPPPDWPWWFALIGFVVGMIGAVILAGVAAAILIGAAGANEDSPSVVVVGTLFQGVAWGATAVFFASRVKRPKLWHFGLRRTPFWRTVGWAALGVLVFYVLSIAYGAIVQPDAEQDTVEKLGGDNGGFGLAVAGVMVIMVAPVVEEFFFRGFLYKCLRSSLHWIPAALIIGVGFGLIHFEGGGVDGLLILPPLAILGVIFCLVYEKTGNLMAPIGMHVFNNSVAYAAAADDGWKVSVVAGPLMFIVLIAVSRWVLPRRRRGGGARATGTVAPA